VALSPAFAFLWACLRGGRSLRSPVPGLVGAAVRALLPAYRAPGAPLRGVPTLALVVAGCGGRPPRC